MQQNIILAYGLVYSTFTRIKYQNTQFEEAVFINNAYTPPT